VPRCRYEFIPHKLPLTFTRDEWKEIHHLFLMEKSSNSIAQQTGFEQRRVFGILCRNGTVWAEVVDDVEAGTLQPLISQKVSTGSIVCSDTWKAYTGIAARGYVHRLVNHGEKQYSDGKGNHINGLEGFWGYLKRKLASKGGIRKRQVASLLRRIRLEIQSSVRSRKDKDAKTHSTLRENQVLNW